MNNAELASELRKLASQTEVIIRGTPDIEGLPPGLTAGIMDATLRLSALLSLLAREVEILAEFKVQHEPPA